MLYSREVLNFLVRKDVRKILKRKDSDAGERGRALEELQSSLFSRFRSSESAKRHEQQLCGPVIALTFNFLVAIGIIFMNKWVLQGVGFHFPICLSFIHYALSWALMAIIKTFSVLPASPPSKSSRLSLFTLGFVMSFSTGLANVVALTVVSIGVAVATVTDLQFSLFGACVALAWIIFSAINKILWSTLQQQDNWTALALMWKTTPITLFFLASFIPFLDPPGVFSYDWNFRNTALILMSALLGFLLQWSGALALGATSAISHVVLGQFKTCVVLLGNYYIFGSNPGATSICRALTAIGGMSCYTYLNICNPKPQTGKLSPGKSSTQSRSSKENGDSHDGYGGESV